MSIKTDYYVHSITEKYPLVHIASAYRYKNVNVRKQTPLTDNPCSPTAPGFPGGPWGPCFPGWPSNPDLPASPGTPCKWQIYLNIIISADAFHTETNIKLREYSGYDNVRFPEKKFK